jgi:hypothetical protein
MRRGARSANCLASTGASRDVPRQQKTKLNAAAYIGLAFGKLGDQGAIQGSACLRIRSRPISTNHPRAWTKHMLRTVARAQSHQRALRARQVALVRRRPSIHHPRQFFATIRLESRWEHGERPDRAAPMKFNQALFVRHRSAAARTAEAMSNQGGLLSLNQEVLQHGVIAQTTRWTSFASSALSRRTNKSRSPNSRSDGVRRKPATPE